MSYTTERWARDPEFRKRITERTRQWRAHNSERYKASQKRYRERLKNGEIQLPELDWAICERGGSEAQAMAHRRRGEKPCTCCQRAETRASAERKRRRARLADAAP
jgi:hypothetical protein